jgi:hypothetical protein
MIGPITAIFIRRASEDLARSALPGARVQPKAPSRPRIRRTGDARRRLAGALRWSADRLEAVRD